MASRAESRAPRRQHDEGLGQHRQITRQGACRQPLDAVRGLGRDHYVSIGLRRVRELPEQLVRRDEGELRRSGDAGSHREPAVELLIVDLQQVDGFELCR